MEEACPWGTPVQQFQKIIVIILYILGKVDTWTQFQEHMHKFLYSIRLGTCKEVKPVEKGVIIIYPNTAILITKQWNKMSQQLAWPAAQDIKMSSYMQNSHKCQLVSLQLAAVACHCNANALLPLAYINVATTFSYINI